MTIASDPVAEITLEPQTRSEVATNGSGAARSSAAMTPSGSAPTPTRPGLLVAAWVLIAAIGCGLVLFAFGPVSEQRDQRALLDAYRAEIDSATKEAFGLGGVQVPTQAPAAGDPVAVIDIEAIGVSRVVIEGTTPEQTRQGPGHVVGTGGPGQPGNSVVVGREMLFGGPFGAIESLERGDRILITTTQGRSVYEVDYAGSRRIEESSTTRSASASTTTTIAMPGVTEQQIEASEEEAEVDARGLEELVVPPGPLTSDQVYGPSPDDRLTLVTRAGVGGDAYVVIARMDGQPYAPTPQGGRTPGNDGRSGGLDVSAALVLALLAFAVSVIGAVWLYRNVPWRSAYLLTAPVLLALTIVLADELAMILPAWA